MEFVPGPHHPRKPIDLPLSNQESISLKINTLRQGITEIQAINRKIKKYDDDFWQDDRYSCKEYILSNVEGLRVTQGAILLT